MQYTLMQRIFEKAVEVKKRGEFQDINTVVAEFKPYIFDSEGEFLIGGKQVHDFIVDSLKLIEKGAKHE